jgi:hypothetical protein
MSADKIRTSVIKTLNQICIQISANNGTGAGGARTNAVGKSFEHLTSNEPRLIENGFVKTTMSNGKYGYYLSKQFDNSRIIFVSQGGLKVYLKTIHSITIFQEPDEAYIIEHSNGQLFLKILEKKAQNGPGSVDTKLKAGPTVREEYQRILGKKWTVQYAFCINQYLQHQMVQPKWTIFKEIMAEQNIPLLFGDETAYFETLDNWIEQLD